MSNLHTNIIMKKKRWNSLADVKEAIGEKNVIRFNGAELTTVEGFTYRLYDNTIEFRNEEEE